MIAANQKVSAVQMSKIRRLDDFDLVMLISEIHDFGWPIAACTLDIMPVDGQAASQEIIAESQKRSRRLLLEARARREKGINQWPPFKS